MLKYVLIVAAVLSYLTTIEGTVPEKAVYLYRGITNKLERAVSTGRHAMLV